MDVSQEFYISERCYITEVSNSSDDPELSIAKARVEPGVTTKWHKLNETVERYYVLSGTGVVEIGDLKGEFVEVGDVVIIPPMCKQRITNSGDVDLVFLAICSPRFKNENYYALKG